MEIYIKPPFPNTRYQIKVKKKKKKIPLGSKLTQPRGSQVGTTFLYRNKEDQLPNSSLLKLEGIELRILVCSISL